MHPARKQHKWQKVLYNTNYPTASFILSILIHLFKSIQKWYFAHYIPVKLFQSELNIYFTCSRISLLYYCACAARHTLHRHQLPNNIKLYGHFFWWSFHYDASCKVKIHAMCTFSAQISSMFFLIDFV